MLLGAADVGHRRDVFEPVLFVDVVRLLLDRHVPIIGGSEVRSDLLMMSSIREDIIENGVD
jgi:hypothetical protein